MEDNLGVIKMCSNTLLLTRKSQRGGMDIFLTHGYFLEADPHEKRIMKPYPPLGLLYISAYLKARGFAVDIFDSTFSDLDTLFARLDAKRPSVVGIYANLITRKNALLIAAKAKEVGSTVILGGPEPANYIENYIAHGVDIVVVGEGEATLAELIAHLYRHGLRQLEGVAGIAFRNGDGKLVTTAPRARIADLDTIPFPDREAIDLESYLSTWQTHHGVRPVSLITARGCPYTCEWCSHSVFGVSHRRRSPENVADEIEWIRDRYDNDQLWYADDVFSINPKWLDRFAQELKRRRLHFPFETITREDRINETIARTLAEMGCYRLWIGAESGSQKVLDTMKRRTNAIRMREMIRLVKAEGIRAGTFIMVGYEGETWDDISETAQHLRESVPDDVLTTLSYPIKGTPYYNKVAHKITASEPWAQSTDRELFIGGRKSRRFYRHAQRWLVAETNLARMTLNGNATWRGRLHMMALSAAHRLKMYLTRFEVDHG